METEQTARQVDGGQATRLQQRPKHGRDVHREGRKDRAGKKCLTPMVRSTRRAGSRQKWSVLGKRGQTFFPARAGRAPAGDRYFTSQRRLQVAQPSEKKVHPGEARAQGVPRGRARARATFARTTSTTDRQRHRQGIDNGIGRHSNPADRSRIKLLVRRRFVDSWCRNVVHPEFVFRSDKSTHWDPGCRSSSSASWRLTMTPGSSRPLAESTCSTAAKTLVNPPFSLARITGG